ncbi:MAG: DUF2007 domain-containing protein [Gammaproteobacteria bacterium]
MTLQSDARICVYNAPNPVEGNLIRGLLESSGIEVELRGEALSGAYPGIFKVGDTRVFVAPRCRDEAKRIIKHYETRNAEAKHWTCGQCGEANTAAFETCWQCQSASPLEPRVRS